MSDCLNCSEYDKEKNFCPKWCNVIKSTIEDARADERRKFAEYLQNYICKESCGERKCIDDEKKCVWYYDINDALAEYEKEGGAK